MSVVSNRSPVFNVDLNVGRPAENYDLAEKGINVSLLIQQSEDKPAQSLCSRFCQLIGFSSSEADSLEDVTPPPQSSDEKCASRRRFVKTALVMTVVGLVALGVYSGKIKAPTQESVKAVASKVFVAMSVAAAAVKSTAVNLSDWFFSSAYPVIEEYSSKAKVFAQEYFAIGTQMALNGFAQCADLAVSIKNEVVDYLNRA